MSIASTLRLAVDIVRQNMADKSKSGSSTKTPWRNGVWFADKMPSFIFFIDGEKSEGKNFVGLDYPDIKGTFSSTMRFGDFGPAKKEVAEAAGQGRYSMLL